MTLPDDLFDAPDGPRPGAAPARKCYHAWTPGYLKNENLPDHVRWSVSEQWPDDIPWLGCRRCYKPKDLATSRRNKNNGKRGRSDELRVARILGGNKLGQLGLPWDVELPGYLRVQCKQLDRWPSLGKVIEWLDAIPAGNELRAVSLADTPGIGGGRTRRLIVMELAEFAAWHGRETPE